ncbi:hypothetical protein NDU88_006348 [Pleurodeles waltl]|uniref:Uncharacterized protein n=1 Tax=Pleurodeles waltl TaxID=8319 RepID=A0AAV7VLN5_PLEWA|nr:hypothetical protein NDU88_006348 [Pleurodeles waltl]
MPPASRTRDRAASMGVRGGDAVVACTAGYCVQKPAARTCCPYCCRTTVLPVASGKQRAADHGIDAVVGSGGER